jgi:hypothetical protein
MNKFVSVSTLAKILLDGKTIEINDVPVNGTPRVGKVTVSPTMITDFRDPSYPEGLGMLVGASAFDLAYTFHQMVPASLIHPKLDCENPKPDTRQSEYEALFGLPKSPTTIPVERSMKNWNRGGALTVAQLKKIIENLPQDTELGFSMMGFPHIGKLVGVSSCEEQKVLVFDTGSEDDSFTTEEMLDEEDFPTLRFLAGKSPVR